jgi:hypothetical protein
MLYSTTDYTYVDENGQNVDPSRIVQHVYSDNNDQLNSHMVLNENTYFNNQQQTTQYRPIVINNSQPL